MRIEDRLRRVLAERAALQRVGQHPWNRVEPDIARRAGVFRSARRRLLITVTTGAIAVTLLLAAATLLVAASR